MKLQKIAIHSAPRSGSTWLGSILDSSPNVAYRFQPLFSYAFKSYLNEYSSLVDIQSFFEEIMKSDDEFIHQKEKKQNNLIPIFSKEEISHVIYKEVRYHNILENLLNKDKEVKLIALIRNPFAVINSWLKAPKEFKADLGWDELEEWKYAKKKNNNQPEEFNGFMKWVECYNIFTGLKAKHPHRVLLVSYSNLLEYPIEQTNKIFEFSNLAMNEQTTNFITKSRSTNNSNAYSVYKKKIKDDAWKKELNPIIKTEIEDFLKISNLDESLW